GNELTFEEVAAAAVVAEAGERLQQVGTAGDKAIACLMAIDREQDRWIDTPFRLDGAKPVVEVRIIALSAADQRRSDVLAQIRAKCSNHPATAAGDRLGPLEVDYTLVDLEARQIGLDRRFANALLAGQRGAPE